MPRFGLQNAIVVFPDHTHFMIEIRLGFNCWISFALVLSCMYFESISLFYLRLYPDLYALL